MDTEPQSTPTAPTDPQVLGIRIEGKNDLYIWEHRGVTAGDHILGVVLPFISHFFFGKFFTPSWGGLVADAIANEGFDPGLWPDGSITFFDHDEVLYFDCRGERADGSSVYTVWNIVQPNGATVMEGVIPNAGPAELTTTIDDLIGQYVRHVGGNPMNTS